MDRKEYQKRMAPHIKEMNHPSTSTGSMIGIACGLIGGLFNIVMKLWERIEKLEAK